MDAVLAWLPAIALVGLGALFAWREPRRLLPGLFLTAALFDALGRVTIALLELAGRLDEDLGAVRLLLVFMAAAVLAILVLAVFLIWNTVEVTRKEGRRLAGLANAAVGIGLLAYLALAVVAVVQDSMPMVVWLLFLGLPIGYLAFVFAAFLLYSLGYGWATKRYGEPVDAVVVLGSGLIAGERVSKLLSARLDLGRRIYQRSRAAGRDTVIIPSGGQGADEKLSEAEAMGRYLLEQGVEPAHVLREDRSTDTRENLEFSSAVMTREGVAGETAVATNNYHAFRAATMMRDAGLSGYAVGAPTARYYWPSATVREFLAILRDNLPVHAVVLAVLCLPVAILTITQLARLLG